MTQPDHGRPPADPQHPDPQHPGPRHPDPQHPTTGLHIDSDDEWHRLSPWTIAVTPVEQLPSLIPVVIAVVVAGRGAPLFTAIATVAVVVFLTLVPWLTVRYQVTEEHVRRRSGLLTRKVATARRDRIRSVDLTASPVHRILRLQKVTIGTGGDDSDSTVKLNAVSVEVARALHDDLMATRVGAGRTRGPASPEATDTAETAGTSDAEVLARFDTSWLRYAPFSLGGLAVAAAAAGFTAQVANDAGLFDKGVDAARDAFDTVRSVPLAVVIVVVTIAVIVVGALLSVLAYVLNYWGFTLLRHRDGTLRTERGLLTTNAVSFDEARIRGSHLSEPILMRPLRGARLHAVATGATKKPLLLPPAPVGEALRVARLVAGEQSEFVTALTPHGRTATLRRLNRGFLSGAVVLVAIAVAVAAGGLPAPWLAVGVLAVAVATGLGLVRARHLGHRLTERSIVVAPPTVARERIALDRQGVIGWATRASVFQRRARVHTLIVASAAGAEHYALVDVDAATTAEITGAVSPEWMRPFLRT